MLPIESILFGNFSEHLAFQIEFAVFKKLWDFLAFSNNSHFAEIGFL